MPPEQMSAGQSIALIGFSEVGQAFAAGMTAAGADVSACDLRAADKALQDTAATLGVTLSKDSAATAAGADLVISAVTAAAALPLACRCQERADRPAPWLITAAALPVTACWAPLSPVSRPSLRPRTLVRSP